MALQSVIERGQRGFDGYMDFRKILCNVILMVQTVLVESVEIAF